MSNTGPDEEIEEYVPEWYPYEGGKSLGRSGPESGIVLRDEEYGDPEDAEDADARLTLERGRGDVPGFILTATLYGWMYHTRTVAEESVAETDYDTMHAALEGLVTLIPYEEDGKRLVAEKTAQLTEAIARFEARFP